MQVEVWEIHFTKVGRKGDMQVPWFEARESDLRDLKNIWPLVGFEQGYTFDSQKHREKS